MGDRYYYTFNNLIKVSNEKYPGINFTNFYIYTDVPIDCRFNISLTNNQELIPIGITKPVRENNEILYWEHLVKLNTENADEYFNLELNELSGLTQQKFKLEDLTDFEISWITKVK